jgi:hypothetical protein
LPGLRAEGRTYFLRQRHRDARHSR